MLCMALSHYALLRSHNTLELELPDLACLELEGEGESRCLAVLLILQHGKTTKHGRPDGVRGIYPEQGRRSLPRRHSRILSLLAVRVSVRTSLAVDLFC